MKGNKSSIKFLAISVAILLVVIVGTQLIKKQNKEEVKANTDLTINISEITDKAKFYPIEIDGTKLEVIAVKASDGTIRTAFNTCQVCYSSGRGYYKQEGNKLVCQNCKNRFSMDEIEVTKGGCNPVPITGENKTVTSTTITISKEFLKEAKDMFKNWKN